MPRAPMGVPSYKAGSRSSTAVQGVQDKRDENLYSSGVLQDGAQGQITLFTVPKGGQIPRLAGAAVIAPVNVWQQQHSDATTNLDKAGELGDGIGDALIRGIAMSCEQAVIDPTDALYSDYGASDYELSQVANHAAVELKVSKKPYFKAPMHTLPAFGGVQGFIAAAFAVATTFTRSLVTNGANGANAIRRIGNFIAADRRDTLEVNVNLATGFVLAGRVAGGAESDGTPFLIQCTLPAFIDGDAR